MITEILFSALVMTTPLVLASLGGLIHRSSGIVNVGLDGMMLLGALVALILASGGNWAVALVGVALSGHSILTWIAWALVPLTAWVLTRTALGLRLRACGTSAVSSVAIDLNPKRMREGAGFVAGALSGLAGAYLSIGVVGLFNEGITGGRGFIALAVFYFGANRPWATAACALLFGIFDAVQIRLQGRGFPEGENETLVLKRRFSASFATNLPLILQEQGVTRIIVTGVKTNVRIRATAQEGFANGFDIVIAREATNSNRAHLAEASLEDIDRYIGRIVPLAEAVEMLE